jgi:tRNA(Ile)-lysidine synthase
MTKLTQLEHQILRTSRKCKVQNAKLLIAVSGGLDSMVLLHALYRLTPVLKWHLEVVHVHHGLSTKAQTQFRARALKRVAQVSAQMGLKLHTNVPERLKLKSEAELREYRRAQVAAVLAKLGGGYLVSTAHHMDDLLETQLMRLIRGTGSHGLVAMVERDAQFFRPLLGVAREALENYAREMNLKWVEDPTNKKVQALRNWLRHKWLPDLEQRVPGGVRRMGLSLQQISGLAESLGERPASEDRLSRSAFLNMGLKEQQKSLVSFLRQKGVKNYTQNHVQEIIKRLDTQRKDFTFTLLKLDWRVSAEHIWTA